MIFKECENKGVRRRFFVRVSSKGLTGFWEWARDLREGEKKVPWAAINEKYDSTGITECHIISDGTRVVLDAGSPPRRPSIPGRL